MCRAAHRDLHRWVLQTATRVEARCVWQRVWRLQRQSSCAAVNGGCAGQAQAAMAEGRVICVVSGLCGAVPRWQTRRPLPCFQPAGPRGPSVATGIPEAGVPPAVGGCHGAEARGLGPPAAGLAARPSASRCGWCRRLLVLPERLGSPRGATPRGVRLGQAASQDGL
jgi:hypothetical protein